MLDATKIIPEEDIPVKVIGRMVLDRYPDNFFAETEQVAFLPTNVVPGIDFSNDPLLQGRLFSYMDTQKSRLGTTNFHQIPINAPKCPMHNFQRDGMMQTHVFKGRATYEPNSLDEVGEDTGPRPSDQGFTTVAQHDMEPTEKLRVRADTFADHFSQPRLFYRSQTPTEQAHIIAGFVFELSKVQLEHVRLRMLGQLLNVDKELAQAVADGLGLALPEPVPAAKEPIDMPPSDALSILKHGGSAAGRCVALLVSEGADQKTVQQLQHALDKAKVMHKVLAEKVGGVTLNDGSHLKADEKIEGAPSVLFDAVALIMTPKEAKRLAKRKPVQDFVSDAYNHCKAIAYTDGGLFLLENQQLQTDAFTVEVTDANALLSKVSDRLWERVPQS